MSKTKPAPLFVALKDGTRVNPALQPHLVKVGALKLLARNANTHNPRNLAAIKSSLEKFGQQHCVVFHPDTMEVLVGNGRLETVRELGWGQIAAIPFRGSQKQAEAFSVADNRAGELAEWDFEVLAGVMRDVLDGDEFSGLDLGWADYELEPFLEADWSPPNVDPDYTGDSDGLKTLTVKVTVDDRDIIRQAIGRAREDNDNLTEGRALALLCTPR